MWKKKHFKTKMLKLLFLISLNVLLSAQQGPNRGQLLWSDEFDYAGSPRTDYWNQELGGNGWGNNELQYYTDKNAQVYNGNLVITAKKEFQNNMQYTSTRLISTRKFKYGVIEMRAKLPKGKGSWPAFWLLAAKRPLNWPFDGEIDIMEHVGYDPAVVHATIHTDKYNHMIGTQKFNKVTVNNIFDDYHLYTLDWNANRLKFYIDNKEMFVYYKEDNNAKSWPFDNEMNIIINTAVGGNWGGAQGIDNSIFPCYYTIDYVRQYAANSDVTPVIKTVALKSKSSGKFVSADEYGFAPLIANRDSPSDWEKFKLINNVDATYTLSAIANSYIVSSDNPSYLQAQKYRPIGDSEKFFATINGDGSYTFQAKSTGKYVRTRAWPAPQLAVDANSVNDADSFFLTYYYS